MASAMALGETPFLASAACSSSAFAMSSGVDGVAPITCNTKGTLGEFYFQGC